MKAASGYVCMCVCVCVLINHPVKEMNGTLTSACPDELLTSRKWSAD